MGIADWGNDGGGLAGRRNCGPRSALALGSTGGEAVYPCDPGTECNGERGSYEALVRQFALETRSEFAG